MKPVFAKKAARPDPELLTLKAELLEAQGDLAQAYRQFDQALDPELVESCVYQISAVKARCNYLIRAIKERSPEAAAAAGLEGASSVNRRILAFAICSTRSEKKFARFRGLLAVGAGGSGSFFSGSPWRSRRAASSAISRIRPQRSCESSSSFSQSGNRNFVLILTPPDSV